MCGCLCCIVYPNLLCVCGCVKRYAIQLLTPGKILAQIGGGDDVGAEEVDEIDRLFFDAKASAKILQEHEDKYLK